MPFRASIRTAGDGTDRLRDGVAHAASQHPVRTVRGARAYSRDTTVRDRPGHAIPHDAVARCRGIPGGSCLSFDHALAGRPAGNRAAVVRRGIRDGSGTDRDPPRPTLLYVTDRGSADDRDTTISRLER